MKTVFLVVLLIPIAVFIGLIFVDIFSTMKRSINVHTTDGDNVRRDYQRSDQGYYKKGQKHGKVIQMRYKAVK